VRQEPGWEGTVARARPAAAYSWGCSLDQTRKTMLDAIRDNQNKLAEATQQVRAGPPARARGSRHIPRRRRDKSHSNVSECCSRVSLGLYMSDCMRFV
jgi:hypothetical protein